MNPNQENSLNQAAEKLKYERQAQQAKCGQAVRGIGCDTASANQSSLRQEAEENARFHAGQVERQSRAAVFFGEHPEFDEFIQLIRAGVIGI